MNAQQQSARLRPFRPVPFGRYTLVSPLSVGGMGEIFLARLEGARGFEKLCVIKKILPSLASDAEFVERFVNEAKILVKLSHGSIAQVLDVGLHEGDPYIALEHVDGKDLRKVAARARDRNLPLPLTFVLYTMSRVLDALAYAHRKRGDDEEEIGLVHRDVSPQNILVSYEGEVKVIDFGLAKSSLSSARTNPSMILGKFLYMSPEQARHQRVDRRSDLYSAGLCLYELVCGRNPFDDVPPHEVMARVANPVVPPIHTVDPLCPPAVQQMVARALEVDPARRFQSAEEFRGKLLSALMEIDPSAGPESVSRYMRESFSQDYQQERKLLAALKGMVRPAHDAPDPRRPDSETAVVAVREVAPTPEAARSLAEAAVLPSIPRAPEPIRPAPLSFAPTPLSREASANGRTDGETAPGALVVSEDRRVEPAVGGLPTDTVILDQRGALVPEDTQPRVVLGTVEPGLARVDTQPRVVVGTLLEEPVAETALEELPEDAFGEAVEPPADEAIPTGPIAPLQRPASAGEAGPPAPRRRLLGWTLAVTAGLAVAAAALWAWERYGVEAVLGPDPLQAERAEPSAPPPAEAPVLAGEQADAAVSGAQVAATEVPDASDTVGAAAAAPDASVTPEASAEVETDAGLAAPVELAAVAQDAGADLLEPLTLQPDPATLVQEAAAKEPAPATRPAVAKRPERPRTQRASPELKRLRQEWAEAQKQFRLLKRDYTCDVRPMKMVCFRMDELEEQLRQTGDEPQEIAALRRRVRVLRYEMRGLTRAGD